MNYYSIEFFKHYLKQLHNQHYSGDINGLEKTLKRMMEFVKEREKNNECAYAKKWMNKPIFKD